MPEPVDPRLPRRSCCAPCCCRCSTVSAVSGSWMEELQDNLLFRWFVGPDLDAPVWDVTVFTKNRNRLLADDVAMAFFERVLAQAKAQHLLSDEHFTVDGMLIEAWAGQKSFKKKTDIPLVSPTDDPSNPAWTSGRAADQCHACLDH